MPHTISCFRSASFGVSSAIIVVHGLRLKSGHPHACSVAANSNATSARDAIAFLAPRNTSTLMKLLSRGIIAYSTRAIPESNSTENELRTFRSLGPQLSGLYLDWGCGGPWSRTIETARRDGFQVYGYEPTASETTNFVVNRRDAISARFDGIFSNNVIEHFRDPVAQFTDFHDLLKDEGMMAHSTPCYEYTYEFTRFHSLFLLGRSPYVLAERTGFKIISSARDGEYINFIFDKL